MSIGRLQPRDFESMPLLENPNKLSVMMILSGVCTLLVAHLHQHLFLYCTLQENRISVKYGICAVTTAALARYAVILRVMGNIDDAYRWGRASVVLSPTVPTTPSARCLALVTMSAIIFPWRQHLGGLVEPNLPAIDVGREALQTSV